MRHRHYNGITILLVGRDGNFSNQVAAMALARVEELDNCAWFFKCVISHGYPLKSSPTFSNCNFGLILVATSLGIFNMHCVRHVTCTCIIFLLIFKAETMICTVFVVLTSLIRGNMRADKTTRLAISHERFVWDANAATTEDDLKSQSLSSPRSAHALLNIYGLFLHRSGHYILTSIRLHYMDGVPQTF